MPVNSACYDKQQLRVDLYATVFTLYQAIAVK